MKHMERKLLFALIVLGAAAGAFFVYRTSPETSRFYPPCLFHALTGFHCPGCGTARALHLLLHGDIPGAFAMNALTMLALPFLLYALVAEAAKTLAGRPVLTIPRFPARSGWYLLFAILFFAILRNIPVYPLTLLAPQ